MLNIYLICACTGKNKESYFNEACAEYIKRCTPYAKINVIECAESDSAILSSIPEHSYKIAMCINAPQLSSEELAQKIDNISTEGHSKITFIIGGSDGFGKEVENAANMKLSFSKLTFPHRLMKVILLEQIYRALNINNGGKYHK